MPMFRFSTGAHALFVLAVILITAWVSLAAPPMAPPSVVPASAAETVFSAERARLHLREITQAPRPIGSPGHARTMAYLLQVLRDAGLEPEVQQTTVIRPGSFVIRAARVSNIMVRLPGADSSGAVVLLAHYDSVAHSPGATDAGNGVATILETLRAIQAGPALRNDVIALITDGEEDGLLGAQAYVDQHRWAGDTGIVLNAEGRGHTGPVFMFRTTGQNGQMIRTLAESVPHAVADSLSDEAFRYMPNDTDLSVFARAGHAGMDFANAHGINHYHYPLDSFEAANPRSLQHHGEYMLSLARAFGNQDLSTLGASDRVYFTLPLAGLIHYPAGWAIPLAVVAVLALVVVLVREVRSERLTVRGLALGLIHFLAALVLVPLLIVGAWMLVRGGIPEVALFWSGTPYNNAHYLMALSFLAAAIYVALILWAGRRLRPADLAAAALCLWTVFAVVTALFMPGGSYLFVWPLLVALAGFTLLSADEVDRPLVTTAILALTAAPIVALLAPMIEGLAEMMTFQVITAPMILLVLSLGLLLPHVHYLIQKWRGWLPVGLAGLSAMMLVYGLSTTGFDKQRKKPNSINYIADANAQDAWWYSSDPEADQWSRLYLGDDPQQGILPSWAPQHLTDTERAPWAHPALLLRHDAPDAEILADAVTDQGRQVRLRVTSPEHAHVTIIRIDDTTAQLLTIDGQQIPAISGERNDAMIYYFGPPAEGIEVEWLLPVDEPAEIYLRSNIPGLPRLDDGIDRQRSDDMMTAGPSSDLTQLQRRLLLPASSGGPMTPENLTPDQRQQFDRQTRS